MSTEQVIVACKIPSGIVVEVGSLEQDNYRRVTIVGPNHSRSLLVGGYAFTAVPKDVWSEFVRLHKSAPYFKNRAIYAEDSMDKAHAAALTDASNKTGFERLNPDKPAEGLVPDADHLKIVKAQAPKLNTSLPE